MSFPYNGTDAVAIGTLAGVTTQGSGAVAIGLSAGNTGQGANSVAVGINAGNSGQLASAVAIGNSAGRTSQGAGAVAIGLSAGQGTASGQGANAIAIGNNAGVASQTAGSICLNASGSALNPAVAGCFINPIRPVTQTTVLGYDASSNEVTYYTAPATETISGTTAISTTIPVTFISGTTHSLASGSTIGQTKTIIKSSANVVSTLGFTSTTASTGTQTISALRYDPVLNRMYVGGAFATIGGVANTVGIAFWTFTTSTWNAMGTGTQA